MLTADTDWEESRGSAHFTNRGKMVRDPRINRHPGEGHRRGDLR